MEMQRYETMLVCNPNLDENQVKAEINKVTEIVNARGGKLDKNIVWGKKELAYPIEKFKYGIYVQLIFDGAGSVVADLDRQLRISEGVIRFITVKKDQYAPDEAPAFMEDPYSSRGRSAKPKRRFEGGDDLEPPEGEEFAGEEVA